MKLTDSQGTSIESLPLLGGKFVVKRDDVNVGEYGSLLKATRSIE